MEISADRIYGTMRSFYLVSLLFTIISLSSCSDKKEVLPDQQVLLFKDTNGLYSCDLTTNAKKLIYKLDSTEFFTDDPCIFSGDTVALQIFKRKRFTKEEFYKRTKSSASRTFIYQTILLATKTLRHRLKEKTVYDFFDEGNFLQRKTNYDSRGKIVSEKDSQFVAGNYSQSRNGIYFNTIFSRFDGISNVGNITVYSFEGNLYKVDRKNNDTSLLLKSPVGYSRKFGKGFLCPVISPLGKSAVFTYVPDFANNLEREDVLMSIDLRTRNIAFLKNGMFRGIEFSDDGRFLLYNRYMEADIAPNVYVLDLKTLKEKRIGEAERAKWMK